MSGYLLRRTLEAALTMLVAVAAVFLAIRLLPNNPVLARYGQRAVPEKIAEQMAEQGWDKPALEQLGDFLWGLLTRGELGESFIRPGSGVSEELRQVLPATMELALASLLLAVPLGITAGVAAAVWRGRWPDLVGMTLALLGVSIPVFFLGMCLMKFSSGLPLGGRLPYDLNFDSVSGFYIPEALLRGEWELFIESLRHIFLPAIALSTIPMAIIARITRSSMLEVLSADYIRTARAKGGSRWRVVWRHALPNASVPVANIAGFQLGMLLTGAVLTETVFSWPGLGTYLMEAVKNSDYAVVQGGALAIAVVFVSLNLVLDVVYMWLDPRIRLH